ncbi:MAG: response regulator [Desulfobacteraceae bacterium]|nr:MAG: response regulator [Desulfobacteraceae bacterium]
MKSWPGSTRRPLDLLKSQFFANVSHELRTPLSLILGPVDRLLRRAALDEEAQHDLLIVQRNARLLHRHVNDLLDIARLDAGRMVMQYARTDLAALARLAASHFETLAADRNIRYGVHAPDALPAEADVEKIERVLINLLSNAFKFTPQGGDVRLVLDGHSGRARFRVQDSGPGVPESMREAIFERFRQAEGGMQRRHGGTGLGLAIVREFVSLHGGTVNVTEAPGGGALFTLDLPLAAPAGVPVSLEPPRPYEQAAYPALDELRQHPERFSSGQSPDGVASRILVVEDNPDMNAFLTECLSPHYRITRAFDGREGLEKALANPPDLILADVMMPGLSGDRMVEELRRYRLLDDVPIVMLTAKADDALRLKLLRHGVQDYIHKPFSVGEVLARVGGLLSERHRTGRRLLQSEERYHSLFESIDQGFCIIEVLFDASAKPVDYRFLETNPSFKQHTGLHDAVGKRIRELVPLQEEHWFETYGRIALTGEPERFINQAMFVGQRWYDVYAFRVGRPEERKVAVLFNDITERKQAEESLRQLNATLEQRVAERTELAETRTRQLQALAVELIEAEERERRRAAHLLHEDLQQVLAGARFHLQAAFQSPPPELTAVVQLLDEAIAKSRRLSNELSPPVLNHSGLVAGLHWLARQMEEQFGLRIELGANSEHRLESSSLKVFMFRAVQELLLNIVKHAGVKSARVDLCGSDHNLAITVSDAGRGFDPNLLDFSETETGLGLLSLRERARYIGGRLVIDSAPGQGSRLTLTVPLSLLKDDQTQPSAPVVERPVSLSQPNAAGGFDKSIRVLFADDHKVMRQGLLLLVAKHADIQVVGEAANGREAYELALRLKPDVIVMDISMPEMDGIEATQRIKAELPSVRVIGLSMHEDEQLARTMRQAGAEAFVSKTASSAELLKAIYGFDPGK